MISKSTGSPGAELFLGGITGPAVVPGATGGGANIGVTPPGHYAFYVGMLFFSLVSSFLLHGLFAAICGFSIVGDIFSFVGCSMRVVRAL